MPHASPHKRRNDVPTDLVPVTADNFVQAESHLYFSNVALNLGGFGKFYHYREPMPIDKQAVVRANRDTLYSGAVFDLDAGPVTIVLPDAGGRFRSMFAISEEEYVPMVTYDAGSYTLTKEQIGSRYVLVGLRTLVDPNSPEDVAAVCALQDAVEVHQARVRDVPVDGFWSVSVYNADGYYQKNAQDAYTINNLTAKKNADGSVTIQFGGCDGSIPNCLPICPGWNYMVRLYRPRREILNGSWKFPDAQPA